MIMQTNRVQMLHPTDTAPLDGGAVAARLTAAVKILGALSRWLWTCAEERGRRRAIQELRRFDKHMLADIGIKPGEIEHAVRGGRRAV
jgi:uncharacterized protein YjiS (DUF1127 family)